jgi:membrane protein
MRRGSLLTQLRDRLARVQGSSRLADRLVRSVDRYLVVQGSLLAAGMTYYGFLALFPLVAVLFGVAAVVSRLAPSVDSTLRDQVVKYAPQLNLDAVTTASIAVGVIGLGVMLYAGVRWVGAMRRAMSLMWLEEPRSTPFVRGLVRDALTLVLLGGAVLVSVALTIVTQLASSVLSGLLGETATAVGVRAISLAAVLVIDILVCWVLLGAAPPGRLRGRERLLAAVLAGLGFEVLKQLGTLIVASASRNVVYGTFAATVGVLIWISYVSKWVLMVGAWAAIGGTPASEVTAGPPGPAQDEGEDHGEQGHESGAERRPAAGDRG